MMPPTCRTAGILQPSVQKLVDRHKAACNANEELTAKMQQTSPMITVLDLARVAHDEFRMYVTTAKQGL